jgi:hypothetical protein
MLGFKRNELGHRGDRVSWRQKTMDLFPCPEFHAETPGDRVRAYRISCWIIVSLVLACSPFILSCGSHEEKSIKDQHRKEIRRIRRALIEQYNPTKFPTHIFGKRKVITYDLQRLLISKDGRPVLFAGNLDGITKEGALFEIHFSSWFFHGPTVSLLDRKRVRFHLKGDYDTVKSVLEDPLELDEASDDSFIEEKDFLVVCRVMSVRKIINYTFEGQTSGEEDAAIKMPDIFSVQGQLLRMVEFPKLDE